MGKKSELILLWTPQDLEEPPVEQVRNTGAALELLLYMSDGWQRRVQIETLTNALRSSFQVISLFTLVEVQLKADGAAMKYSAALQRPEESRSST